MATGGVANVGPTPCEEKASAVAAVRIKEEAEEVRQLQEWWSHEDGLAAAAAARRPVLACVEMGVLAEIVSAGGNYHTILSADRLDGLHRQYGSGTEPSLEPLRKALQSRGGAKSQARVVGSLLFKEARALHEQFLQEGPAFAAVLASIATPARSAASAVGSPAKGAVEAVKLDEAFMPPRRYGCSEAYPAGALMAARAGPTSRSEIVAKLPADFQYFATGRSGDWLEVQVERNGTPSKAYVQHTISGQVMLVDKTPVVVLEEAWSPARRWIHAEGYPEGAQMAARLAPSREGKQAATLPPDFDYHATGRTGDYLQILLDLDGTPTAVYVLHRLDALVLLKPAPVAVHLEPRQLQLAAAASPQAADTSVASLLQLQQLQQLAQARSQQEQQRAAEAAAAARLAAAEVAAARAADFRVEALEAKVSLQERQIQALQSEIRQLKSAFTAVCTSAASSLAAAAQQAG